MIRGFYCLIGTSSNRRSCFGGEIGQDANPSLEFVSPTVLQMAKIRNYVVGPSMIFQFPVSTKITFTTKLGYLIGLSAGQNSNLSVKSDAKIIAEAGLGGDLTDRFAMSLMFNYFSRNSKVEGIKGSNTESWTTTSSGLGARLAGTFNF
jgi:hypothetical protein